MTDYQVMYRAYNAEYKNNPPRYTAMPRQSIVKSHIEANEIENREFYRLIEVSKKQSFPTIVEIKIEATNGKTYDYKKWSSIPEFNL